MTDRLIDRVRQNRNVKVAAPARGAGMLRRLLLGGGDDAVSQLMQRKGRFRTIDDRGHVINRVNMPTKMLLDLKRKNQYGYDGLSLEQLKNLTRHGPTTRPKGTIRNMFFGNDPVWTLQQRLAKGGLLGKGGLAQAEFALQPHTRQSLRNLKPGVSGKAPAAKAKDVALSLPMEVAGKGFVFGAPVMAGHQFITNTGDPDAGRVEDFARRVGDGAGWLVGLPAGLAGGVGASYALGEAGRRVGAAADSVFGTGKDAPRKAPPAPHRAATRQPKTYQDLARQVPTQYYR